MARQMCIVRTIMHEGDCMQDIHTDKTFYLILYMHLQLRANRPNYLNLNVP